MSVRTSRWPAGSPCWADLSAPDIEAAKQLYGSVLGWDYLDPGPDAGGYLIANKGGAATSGLGPLQGGSAAWTLYFASDDVDATARAISEHGGTVLAGPFDVMGAGRMCVAMDPTGVAFGVWQAQDMIGASLVNEPGGIVWEDLQTSDPDRARAFYREVFGHRYEQMEGGPTNYATFALEDGTLLGGTGPVMDGDAPRWLVYFAVESTDACVDGVTSAGGRVVVPAEDSPYGRIAVLADPAGAVFAVLQTSGEGSPDRSG